MAKIPSICLIPSGYKATKIYSVLPTDGSADLTFDRGTSDDQTRVNSNGLIEDVAVDVPRLDYSDGGCPSLLLEPATTNLVTYSEDISNAAWVKGSGGVGVAPIVTSNFAISPKGDLTADRVQLDSGGGTTSSDFSYIARGETVSSGATVTFSVYLKSNTGSNQTIIWYEGQDVNYNESFTITTEWQRFEFTSVVPATTSSPLIGLRPTYQGLEQDATADFLMWGGQLEEQSYATSYVPSLAATNGVRAAETASTTGLSSYINSTEGVLYAEISALADDLTFRSISINSGSNNVTVDLRYRTTSNRINIVIKDGINPDFNKQATLLNITDFYKFAVKYSNGSVQLWVNGLKEIDLSPTISLSGLNTLSFNNGSSAPFYGKTKDLRVYKEALSDLDLARLTGFTSFLEMRNYLNYTAE